MHLTEGTLDVMSDAELDALHNDLRNREKAYARYGLWAMSRMWASAASEVLRLQATRALAEYRDSLETPNERLFP